MLTPEQFENKVASLYRSGGMGMVSGFLLTLHTDLFGKEPGKTPYHIDELFCKVRYRLLHEAGMIDEPETLAMAVYYHAIDAPTASYKAHEKVRVSGGRDADDPPTELYLCIMKGQDTTMAEAKAKAKAKAKPAKDEKERVMVLGMPPTVAIRSLAVLEYSSKQITDVLTKLGPKGLEVKESTLRTQMGWGKRGSHPTKALTNAQKAEVNALVGKPEGNSRKPAAEKKPAPAKAKPKAAPPVKKAEASVPAPAPKKKFELKKKEPEATATA